MRKGNSEEAKKYVDAVRQRYFKSSDRTAALNVPGPGLGPCYRGWHQPASQARPQVRVVSIATDCYLCKPRTDSESKLPMI